MNYSYYIRLTASFPGERAGTRKAEPSGF